MTKQEIVAKMHKTISMLEKLEDEQFRFDEDVTEWDEGNVKVACIAGWYPSLMPEVGVTVKRDLTQKRSYLEDKDGNYPVVVISDYHGFETPLFEKMFYPNSVAEHPGFFNECIAEQGVVPQITINSTRIHVINVWKTVAKIIEETDKFDKYLQLV